ncbi:MAG: hypothetical protein O7E54_06110 [Planctomycetota bacterium]|nr:hypothetical protein [Planctomycetota bacterium]
MVTDSCVVRLDGARVDCRCRIDLPYDPAPVWAVVSNLPRFLTVDPFHERVERRGRRLRLWHNAFGFRCLRVGRILHWHEGRGYAFSDLSLRGPRRGFPHVFFVTVEPRGCGGSCLVIRVRGKWTARWMPRFCVRAWLRFVVSEHARLLRRAFCVA